MQDAVDPVISAQVALAGAVLAAAGAAFAVIPLAMLRHAFPGRSARPVAWGIVHVVLIALLYLSVASILVGKAGAEPDLPTALLVTVATQGIAVAAILYWAKKHDPGGWAGLGIQRGGNLRALWFGGLAGLMSYPMIWGATILWPWMFERMGGDFEPQPFIEGFANASPLGLLLAVPAAAVVVPLLEEILFRGFVQSLAVQRLGEVRGVILASALFAILHGPSAFLPIFVLALVLGVVMLRTGSIVAPWALHGFHNGLQILLLLTLEQLTGLPQ